MHACTRCIRSTVVRVPEGTRAGRHDPARHPHSARRSMTMQGRPRSRRRALVAGLVALAGVAGAAKLAIGSDHQDTPFVELNPKTDLTDVYAFPGTSGRIAPALARRPVLH